MNQAIRPETVAEAARLVEVLHSGWKSQAVYVAAKLNIADRLENGPRTAEALAQETGASAPALQRLLRALVTLEICREREDGSFEITPMGSLLGTHRDGSVRAHAIYWGSELYQVWGHLLDSILTGKSARTLISGTTDFEHLTQNPELAALFNQGMGELTRLVSQSVVHAYDWAGFRRIVDVGGGYGELLAALLKANPAAQGVLFDLPHSMDQARDYMAAAGLADRCEFISGSFFDAVPAGGDAYVLKSVIHDWTDERSTVILKNCRRAIQPEGKLLLVERIMPEHLDASPQHQAVVYSDLNMLVALAAQERTEAEFPALLANAGFQLTRVLPVGLTFSLIEAVPSGRAPGSFGEPPDAR